MAMREMEGGRRDRNYRSNQSYQSYRRVSGDERGGESMGRWR